MEGKRRSLNLFLVGSIGVAVASCAAPSQPTVDASSTIRPPSIAMPTTSGRFGQVITIDPSPDRKQFWQKVYRNTEGYCTFPTTGVNIVEIAPGQNFTTIDGNPVTSLFIPPSFQGEKPKIAVKESPHWPNDEAFARDNNATLEQVARASEAIGIIEERVHACTPDYTDDPFSQEPFFTYADPKTYIDGLTGKAFIGTITAYPRQKLNVVLKLTKRNQDGTVKEEKFSEAGNTEELITGWARRVIVNEIFGPDSLEAKVSNQTTYHLPGVRAMDNLFQAAHADLRTVLKAKESRDMKTIFNMLSTGLEAVGEANGIKTTSPRKNDPASKFMLFNVITKLSAPGTEREIPSRILTSIFSDLSQFYYGKEFGDLAADEQRKIVAVMNSLLKDTAKKISGILPSQTQFFINGKDYYIAGESWMGILQLVSKEEYILMLLSEFVPGFRYNPQKIVTARRMTDTAYTITSDAYA